MITKGKIIDQILRLSAGGSTNDEKEISREDIALIVSQVINRLLKTEHLSVNMPLGADYPPHTLITTYKVLRKQISAERVFSRDYYLSLPVMPISLPRNMGIWSITDDQGSTEFIPIESGQQHHLKKQEGLILMEQQPYYWVEGQTIYIRYPLFQEDGGKEYPLRVKLLIVDPTVIGEYDYLQIPIEMEEAVVKEVLTLIGALPKVVDKASDTNNQI